MQGLNPDFCHLNSKKEALSHQSSQSKCLVCAFIHEFLCYEWKHWSKVCRKLRFSVSEVTNPTKKNHIESGQHTTLRKTTSNRCFMVEELCRTTKKKLVSMNILPRIRNGMIAHFWEKQVHYQGEEDSHCKKCGKRFSSSVFICHLVLMFVPFWTILTLWSKTNSESHIDNLIHFTSPTSRQTSAQHFKTHVTKPTDGVPTDRTFSLHEELHTETTFFILTRWIGLLVELNSATDNSGC